MRFDILDEYATLVPFGLGVSKHNRVVHPTAPEEAVKPEATAKSTSRLKALLIFVRTLGQIRGREASC
jgi:hypothetical protein